jgi:mono/diheme cytochrome c family protein
MKSLKWNIFATLVFGLGLAGCDGAQTALQDEAGEAVVERRQDAAQVARGKAVYDGYCLECHGAGGKGQPGDWRVRDADGHFPPPPLDDSAHAWHHPTADLLAVIREGSPQGQGKMPAWQGRLSEQQMHDVVAYIKSLWSDEVYALWSKLERQSLEP